ncbi:MAG: hypothetical protein IJM59_10085 [Proteobacteria bacterium]|nr:hypothetical protein [Pseudomonadota bacterium]
MSRQKKLWPILVDSDKKAPRQGAFFYVYAAFALGMRGVFVLLAHRQYALKIFLEQKKNKFHFGASIA